MVKKKKLMLPGLAYREPEVLVLPAAPADVLCDSNLEAVNEDVSEEDWTTII